MVSRRHILAGVSVLLGAATAPLRTFAKPSGPANALRARQDRWRMETLWSYRFHAGGQVQRPMGHEQPVRVRTGQDWVTIDFINGDARISRVPGGLADITNAEMRADLARGLTALGLDPASREDTDFTRFSAESRLGETGTMRVELIPVTQSSAAVVRRFDRVDGSGVRFWDREVFMIRQSA